MSSAVEMLARLSEIRTFPDVALRISELTATERATVSEIEALVRMDPILVSRILRMVNSAYYGLRAEVESVSKAIIYLGMKTLRNVVVVDALKGFFITEEEEGGAFSRRRLWLHSTGVGICAQLISRRLYSSPGEDAFLAGILHEIGLMIEDQIEGETLQQVVHRYRDDGVSLTSIEREMLGTDHCELGVLAARQWNFPEQIQDVIARHHTAIENERDLASLTALTQIAKYITEASGYRMIEGREEFPGGVVGEHIESRADDYKVLAEDFQEEMSKAAALYEVDEP